MADATKIRWAGSTWNPMSGCIEVSPGCAHCYAKAFAERQRGTPAFPIGFDPIFKPWKLNDPIRWKEGRRVFVDSMSDLFFEDFDDQQIAEVFNVMLRATQHDYIVLTKRPERMRDWLRAYLLPGGETCWNRPPWNTDRIPPHIWLGTTIENDRFTYRADVLREIPVDVRVISAEPLLSPLPSLNLEGIGWLIVGGESGPGYRPMPHAWARDLRDRALASGVPFFFKQSAAPRTEMGVELDGERWEQYPQTQGRQGRGGGEQEPAQRDPSEAPASAGPPGLGL